MGFAKLKDDLKNNTLGNFYIFHGDEHYLKSFYIEKIEKQLVEGAFKSFNFEKFDQFNFNIDEFSNAVESYPAMAERKFILVHDIDIFKLKSDDKDQLLDILNDLPEYVCVVFDYTVIEYKPDGRVKLGQLIKKKASVVQFERLKPEDLKPWIMRRFRTFKLDISPKDLDYLIFSCGSSMSDLSNETSKLSGYCKGTVTREDIDLVCTKALEAKIFDVSDHIINGRILKAIQVVDELIMMKNDEFAILSVINSQFQRLYITKLCLNEGKDNKFLANAIGTKSTFAVNINIDIVRPLSVKYLRETVNACANGLAEMVSNNLDKSEILQILITKIGGLNGKN